MAEKTTIPIPKIYAYAFADSPEPLSSFLILEYVEGQKLSFAQLQTLSDEQRTCLYTSLADIHIQLRRLEFPSIGCLTHGLDGFKVCKKAATIDTNMQELEGLQLSKIQASYYNGDGLLTSANDYVAMLLQIAHNAFVEGRNSVLDEDHGADALYHLHIFRQYAERWVDRLDRGPFVLVHGDLEPFNLIVDEGMNILSVLDWEWSRVVPRQFFKPPLWLGIPDTTKLAFEFVYVDYLKRFDQLHAVVRARELEKYGDELLSDEWAKAKENSGFLVANALENWTDMDWFANRYINRKWYRGIDLDERVRAFMEEDSDRKSLIARKLREGIAYRAEVDRLKDTGAPDHEDDHVEAVPSCKRFLLHRLWNDALSSVTPSAPKLALWSAAIIIVGTSYLLRKRIIPH